MGQHFVDRAALDATVVGAHPGVDRLEVGPSGGLTMVEIWSLVGSSPVASDPPMLFNRFRLDADLDVWVLQAWVLEEDPTRDL